MARGSIRNICQEFKEGQHYLPTSTSLSNKIWLNISSGYVGLPIEAVKEHMREKE